MEETLRAYLSLLLEEALAILPLDFDFSAASFLIESSLNLLLQAALLYAAIHILAFLIGLYINSSHKEQHPDDKNYRWGYIYGLLHFKWFPLMFAFMGMSFIWAETVPEVLPISAILLIFGLGWATLMSILGLFILKRSYVAILIASFFSPNIILFLCNLVYCFFGMMNSEAFKKRISPALKEAAISKRQTQKAMSDFERQVLEEERRYLRKPTRETR